MRKAMLIVLVCLIIIATLIGIDKLDGKHYLYRYELVYDHGNGNIKTHYFFENSYNVFGSCKEEGESYIKSWMHNGVHRSKYYGPQAIESIKMYQIEVITDTGRYVHRSAE